MSDTAIPRLEVKWREVGIGYQSLFKCMGCNTSRSCFGRRGLGVKQRCAVCVAKRAQS